MFILCKINWYNTVLAQKLTEKSIRLMIEQPGKCCQKDLPRESLVQWREQRGQSTELWARNPWLHPSSRKSPNHVLTEFICTHWNNEISLIIQCPWEKHSYPLHTHSAPGTVLRVQRNKAHPIGFQCGLRVKGLRIVGCIITQH